MALLQSEDEQVRTSFNLIFIKDQIKDKVAISWIPYKIIFQSAKRELTFEKKKNDKGSGDYVFALKPINEIENLIDGIKNFISSKTSKLYSFEPMEPSFELILERSHKGYSVICWADAGNVISDHYTWDGFGVRFFTNEEKIFLFVKELSKEKENLGVIEKM